MSILTKIGTMLIGTDDFPKTWRERLSHHDKLIEELTEASQEAHILNQRLGTGNIIEDMVTGKEEHL